MERTGDGNQPGLVFAVNNSGETVTRTVTTGFKGRPLRAAAWSDKAGSFTPVQTLAPASDGKCVLAVGPRGYVVYVP